MKIGKDVAKNKSDVFKLNIADNMTKSCNQDFTR